MTTALQVINRAFSISGVRAAETPIQPEESVIGLDILNDHIKMWSNLGILPGALPINDTSDELNVPEYAEPALKYYVAAAISVEYNIQVTQQLAFAAEEALNNLITINTNMGIDIDYPSTLPLGSGNRTIYKEDADVAFFPEVPKDNF